MPRQYYVYILASNPKGTLHIGITNNLAGRVWEHKQVLVERFTKNHSVHRLAYYEVFASAIDAIQREERLKKWNRAWKNALIESRNRSWEDLSGTVIDMP